MASEFTTSRYLLLIATGLICIGAATAGFITFQVKSLQHDASAINHLGIVRGSMQRVAKQEIAGIHALGPIAEIDSLLAGFNGTAAGPPFTDGLAHDEVELLRIQWSRMTKAIRDYREQPAQESRAILMAESERCWVIASNAVLAAQFASEAKLRLFRVVFVLMGLNIMVILFFIRFNRNQVRNRLELLAHIDPLTRAFNRYTYETRLEEEMLRARRYDRPLSLILLDIDHFKAVNDTWGHRKGDRVLQELTRLARGEIRQTDSFCRIGGEEFAVIVPETPLSGACALARKFRKTVDEFSGEDTPKVTISLGVAQYVPGEETAAFFRRADRMLYAAKDNGRNRVEPGAPEGMAFL